MSGGGKPTGAELANVLKVGDKVKKGPDWGKLVNNGRLLQEGRGIGTVTAAPSKMFCWADVQWENGHHGRYCMGASGFYELELA